MGRRSLALRRDFRPALAPRDGCVRAARRLLVRRIVLVLWLNLCFVPFGLRSVPPGLVDSGQVATAGRIRGQTPAAPPRVTARPRVGRPSGLRLSCSPQHQIRPALRRRRRSVSLHSVVPRLQLLCRAKPSLSGRAWLCAPVRPVYPTRHPTTAASSRTPLPALATSTVWPSVAPAGPRCHMRSPLPAVSVPAAPCRGRPETARTPARTRRADAPTGTPHRSRCRASSSLRPCAQRNAPLGKRASFDAQAKVADGQLTAWPIACYHGVWHDARPARRASYRP